MNAIERKKLYVNLLKSKVSGEITAISNNNDKLRITINSNFIGKAGSYGRIFDLNYGHKLFDVIEIIEVVKGQSSSDITLNIEYDTYDIIGKTFGLFKVFTTALINVTKKDCPFVIIEKPNILMQINEVITDVGSEIALMSITNIKETMTETESEIVEKIIYDNIKYAIEVSNTPLSKAEISGMLDIIEDMIISGYVTNIAL